MKLSQALELLASAPKDNKPSAINRGLTRAQSVGIVEKVVATLGRPEGNPCGPDDDIADLMELRVWQVAKDQKHPRY